MVKKINIGVVGAGNISDIYLKNCTEVFDNLEVIAIANRGAERLYEKQEEYDIPVASTPEELINNQEVEIVLNLTTPDAHAEITRSALNTGKHVYGEKPLTIELEEGKAVLELAKEKGLKVGCAPDTFLGGGLQTCRKLIDDGWIGKPIASTAFMLCHGHESWHPDPEFYYKIGGGPMLDIGPYYLTALVSLIGPISRVTGSARITYPERTITSEKKYGQKIEVEVATHIAGTIDFENGAIGTIITSFDVWDCNLPRIEIYGSEGTLQVPDPNTFDGPIFLKRHDHQEWKEIPLSHGYSQNSRGLGLSDMAQAIMDGREHRASGQLAYHVLEAMHGFQISSDNEKHYHLESYCKQPAALE